MPQARAKRSTWSASTERSKKKLADETYSAETEVVDIVSLHVRSDRERSDMSDRRSDVVEIKRAALEGLLVHRLFETLVEAEAADRRNVVTVSGKE